MGLVPGWYPPSENYELILLLWKFYLVRSPSLSSLASVGRRRGYRIELLTPSLPANRRSGLLPAVAHSRGTAWADVGRRAL